MRHLLVVPLLCASCLSAAAQELRSVEQFQPAAEKAKSLLTIPTWPQTPAELEQRVTDAIDKAKQLVTMAIQYSDGRGRGTAPVNVLAFAEKTKKK